jgi:hypothetical protein
MSDASSGDSKRAADLFDLRRIIGGLFLLYGVIVTLAGLLDDDTSMSAGLRINLMAGIGMLVLGALFIAWALWRPLGDQLTAGTESPAEAQPPERSD